MIRKLIFWLLILGFGVYVYFQHDDLRNIAEAISQGKTAWLLTAVIIEIIYYLVYILIFKESFSLVGLKRTFREMVPLVFGAFFVNVLAPAAGHSGTVLFAYDAKERKESVGKAVIAVIITFFAIYLALIAFLATAIVNLQIIGELGYSEIIASAFFLVLTIIPIVAVWAGHFRPKTLRRILNFIYKMQVKLHRIFKDRKDSIQSWVEESAAEIDEAATSANKNIKKSALIIILALISHFINISCLLIIFFSLGLKLKYGAAIAGYAFGEVARVISPQPEGIGAVEVTMVLILAAFGVPPIIATTAVIIFRALNIWVPMGIGFFYLKTLKSFQTKGEV